MKKLLLAKIFLLITTFVINAQDWERYKSEELAFIANFPGQPKLTIQKVNTAVGELDMHMVMYTPITTDDNVIYSVIRSDYPESQFKDADESYNTTVLNGAVQGAVSNVNGKLIFDNKIKHNGYPGRSIKIEIDQGYMYIKSYLIDNIMYITQVICLKSNDNNVSIDRFFNSFDILKIK